MNANYLPPRRLLTSEIASYDVTLARFLQSKNAAILLKKICDWVEYLYKHDQITNDPKHGDGWIFLTVDAIEEQCYISEDEQRAAVKKLIDNNLIEKQIMGIPGKRYFRINKENIESLMNQLDKAYNIKKEITRTGNFPELDQGNSRNSIREKAGTAHNIECLKEDSNINIKSEAGASCSADAERAVSFFIQTLKKIKPDITIPSSLKRWQKEFELLMKQKKCSVDRLIKVMEWLPTNSFWSKNVLSGGSFREKFDRLEIEMADNKNKSGNISAARTHAEKIMNEYKTRSEYAEIHLTPQSITFVLTQGQGEPKSIRFTDHGFQDQVDSMLKNYNFKKKQ